MSKPHEVYELKTAKDGPNKGLVTNNQGGFDPKTNKFEDPKMQKNWEELQESGHKFDEQGVLRDANGNAYHGDYDMQGVNKIDDSGMPVKDPKDPDFIDTNNPDFQKEMNDKATPDKKMTQHGANDQYVDPETGDPLRTPKKDESYLAVDENGNVQTFNSTSELKKFYKDREIPWPYK